MECLSYIDALHHMKSSKPQAEAGRHISVRQGFDIPLAGQPGPDLEVIPAVTHVAVLPVEFSDVKMRLLVRVGDRVKRGSPLVEDKRNPAFRLCAPAAGRVVAVDLGPRRAIERVVIERDGDDAEDFGTAGRPPASLSREEVLNVLQTSGLLGLIEQRPYGRLPDPTAKPKAIFVNAMGTAPFSVSVEVALKGRAREFHAGLAALGRLTDGPVNLVAAGGPVKAEAIATVGDLARLYTFSGPHPAGNTSVHIHHISPIRPGEVVWAVKAPDVVAIGSLLLTGCFPTDRVIALGGPAVYAGKARHYRLPWGCPLSALLEGRIEKGARVIAGDALSGSAVRPDSYLPMRTSSITILPEDRSRHFLAWANPLANGVSASRLFLSSWLPRVPRPLGTNRHGAVRAMIVTGLYDRFLPMRIRLDFLIRAILSRDWEEAVQLGLLEIVPEDVALAAYACPSKMDLVGIVREGLRLAAAEGI
ncbi:MAG: NADH:ubiquinone reductase (Na(+)-transporting) subunit A [Kiritimatiellae bacterium]|nr:NADH:ubiquinone reductase (Na(+)-transporting) subunit A [Kiritimatiellia bacterium]